MRGLADIAAWLQQFDRRAWPAHRVALTERMRAALTRDKLIIADVGAAAGPETHWLELAEFIHLLTFEPLPRENVPKPEYLWTNFQVALGAERRQAELRLMKNPDASTLREVNHPRIDDFVIADGLKQTGTLPIELDTLDHCLESRAGLSPHFLKVDVEGADLDVLRGAQKTLQESILAIKIEVSFLERHKGAPFFSDTDAFLREHGFQIFQLSQEKWIRRNNVYGYTTEPQLAWGDALYFLSREKFLERISSLEEPRRELETTRFITTLLAYGIHDYAMELIEQAEKQKLLPHESTAELRKAVQDSMEDSPLYLVESCAGVLFSFFVLLLCLPVPSTRERGIHYLKQRAGRFLYLFRRLCTRGGPQGSCISE